MLLNYNGIQAIEKYIFVSTISKICTKNFNTFLIGICILFIGDEIFTIRAKILRIFRRGHGVRSVTRLAQRAYTPGP